MKIPLAVCVIALFLTKIIAREESNPPEDGVDQVLRLTSNTFGYQGQLVGPWMIYSEDTQDRASVGSGLEFGTKDIDLDAGDTWIGSRSGKGQSVLILIKNAEPDVRSAGDLWKLIATILEDSTLVINELPASGVTKQKVIPGALIASGEITAGMIERDEANPKITALYSKNDRKYFLVVAVNMLSNTAELPLPETDRETVGLFYKN